MKHADANVRTMRMFHARYRNPDDPELDGCECFATKVSGGRVAVKFPAQFGLHEAVTLYVFDSKKVEISLSYSHQVSCL